MSDSKSGPPGPHPPYPGIMYHPPMPYPPPHGYHHYPAHNPYPPYPYPPHHQPHHPSAQPTYPVPLPNPHCQAVHHDQEDKENDRGEEVLQSDPNQPKRSSAVPPPGAMPYPYPGPYPYYPPPQHHYYNVPYPPNYPAAPSPHPGMMQNNPYGAEDPRFANDSTSGSQEQQSMSNDDKNNVKDYLERNKLARKKEQDLKKMMKTIVAKDPQDRTEEEAKAFNLYEERRKRKNKRSRERTKEKAREMNRILSIPENQRTDKERVWLEVNLKAKRRKNEGDRQRRERIKILGQSSSRSSLTSAQSQDLSDFDFLFNSNLVETANKEVRCAEQSSGRHSSIFRSVTNDSHPMETVGEQEQQHQYQQEATENNVSVEHGEDLAPTRSNETRPRGGILRDSASSKEPTNNSRPITPTSNMFDKLVNSMHLSPLPQSGNMEDALPLLSPLTGSHSTSLISKGASEDHPMDTKDNSNSYARSFPMGSVANAARNGQHNSRPAKQLLLYSSSVSTVPMGTGTRTSRKRHQQYQHDMDQGSTVKHVGRGGDSWFES